MSVSLLIIIHLSMLYFSSQRIVHCQEYIMVVLDQLRCRLPGLIDLDLVVSVVSIVGEERFLDIFC